MNGNSTHIRKQFIPQLLYKFLFDGPNGHHQCLVEEPVGCSITKSKQNSTNLMFLWKAARSAAVQLILGLSYLHANSICHGGIDWILHFASHDPLLM